MTSRHPYTSCDAGVATVCVVTPGICEPLWLCESRLGICRTICHDMGRRHEHVRTSLPDSEAVRAPSPSGPYMQSDFFNAEMNLVYTVNVIYSLILR